MDFLNLNKKVLIDHILTGIPFVIYFLIAILIFFSIKEYYKVILKEIVKLFNDTLKINGGYSRTSLTMFSSFFLGTIYAAYSLIKSGFDFNVFLVYMLIATGIKISDAYSKKLVGNVTPEEPKEVNLNVSTEKIEPNVG